MHSNYLKTDGFTGPCLSLPVSPSLLSLPVWLVSSKVVRHQGIDARAMGEKSACNGRKKRVQWAKKARGLQSSSLLCVA
jgi:hypothetical protein